MSIKPDAPARATFAKWASEVDWLDRFMGARLHDEPPGAWEVDAVLARLIAAGKLDLTLAAARQEVAGVLFTVAMTATDAFFVQEDRAVQVDDIRLANDLATEVHELVRRTARRVLLGRGYTSLADPHEDTIQQTIDAHPLLRDLERAEVTLRGYAAALRPPEGSSTDYLARLFCRNVRAWWVDHIDPAAIKGEPGDMLDLAVALWADAQFPAQRPQSAERKKRRQLAAPREWMKMRFRTERTKQV